MTVKNIITLMTGSISGIIRPPVIKVSAAPAKKYIMNSVIKLNRKNATRPYLCISMRFISAVESSSS